ncbi:hypothetical protein ABZS78_39705, partial [Streptomyces decoyicus]
DIAARGHTPSWTCSRDNRPSRLLAWTAGFRLLRPFLPVSNRRCGRWRDHRQVIDGILHRVRWLLL